MNRWKWITLLLLTALSLIAEFTSHHHSSHWWAKIPAFWIFFGLIGCLGLIFFAKTLGKILLNRKEDHYHGR